MSEYNEEKYNEEEFECCENCRCCPYDGNCDNRIYGDENSQG